MARLELRWIEVGVLAGWPWLEEFLAIIFFERQRGIGIAPSVDSENLTADEALLLESLTVAHWDTRAAARHLRRFLNEASATAAACAAAKMREALCTAC